MLHKFTEAEVAAHFPDYKMAGSEEFRAKQCPRCGRSEYKFYINLIKGATNCKHCEFSPALEVLIGEARHKKFFLELHDRKEEDPLVPLPDNLEDLEDMPMMHPMVLYLARRRFTAGFLASYGVKYCTGGPHKNRLIFPFYSPSGEYRGFQGRYIRDNLKNVPKWRTATGTKKSQIVYNFRRVYNNQNWCLLTEGIFDCLRFPDWAVCILGKSPSEYQRSVLDYFRHIFIALDPDAYKEAQKIKNDIVPEAFLRVAVLPLEDDPDTYSEESMREMIMNNLPNHFSVPMGLE